jgi:multidrug efflux pump subunit AcrB
VDDRHLGFTATIVKKFLTSNLPLLLIIASFALGAWALQRTPREEEPQIVVPMVDVLVSFPGASAEEVERLVAANLETKLWEVTGVEHVYSMSRPGSAVITLRFAVGEDRERALINAHSKIQSYADRAPPGLSGWIVKAVDIDDVPILTLTLFGEGYDGFTLRRIGDEILDNLQSVPDASAAQVVGGQRREIRVELDPQLLASRGVSPMTVAQALRAANADQAAGTFEQGNAVYGLRTSAFLETAEEVESIVVAVADGRPVLLRDVAGVTDGPEEVSTLTRVAFGPAGDDRGVPEHYLDGRERPAVTISLAKRKGSNAVSVAHDVLDTVDDLRGHVIPDDVQVLVTRNYGETADHKVNELVGHILVAIITVVLVLALGLGWREALVVAIAVPMTFSAALFADLVTGYTINRVTLFALVLSLGLLVDDPIVDVENIHRHFRLKQRPPLEATLFAVNEVRPPLINATFTVIVAFLPMFFVSGMMGPYMRPMPFNVPVVMLASLVVALTVTPWFAHLVLKGTYGKEEKPFVLERSIIYRVYRKIMRPMIEHRTLAYGFLFLVVFALIGSMGLVVLGLVPLKMLPFDNKNELQLVVDMPEGTPLEKTDRVVRDLGDVLRTVPEVADYQSYVGHASPHDFNGLVRRYFLRRGPHLADVRVTLADKADREMQSHSIALRIRPAIEEVAERHGAVVRIVEAPPGPPVLATVVGEVLAPPQATWDEQIEQAKKVKGLFARVDKLVEVDDMIEADQPEYRFVVDREKAALSGIAPADIAMTLRGGVSGHTAGTLHVEGETHPLVIRLRLPRADRSSLAALERLPVGSRSGGTVPLGELGSFVEDTMGKTIFRKDLRRVAYVTGEMAGRSPVEAILDLHALLREEPLPEGWEVRFTGEGEWQITVDVFRDLGLAFAGALLGIYILLVAQTGSLSMPLIIMVAIPITMVGIMPGFAILNLFTNVPIGPFPNPTFFTATAMIGMIALAGIVVRNAIILIDFIQLTAKEEGLTLGEAVVRAGAVRFKPIMLTASTSMLGTWVMTLDPIFSGLAWAFIFGISASTLFTLVVVPLLYYLIFRSRTAAPAVAEGA